MKFQFTPLREGRHRRHAGRQPRDVISIHAPPRGATKADEWLESGKSISIHAPPRGATGLGDLIVEKVDISIHAPPRGATARLQYSLSYGLFQFTPLREGRPHRTIRHSDACPISIHAPPRGATFQPIR